MAKGASQQNLDRGIVSSAPAATRVAEIARLVPLVLLREDRRVREGYVTWRPDDLDELRDRVTLMAKLYQTWDAWSPTPEAVLQDRQAEILRAELHEVHLITKAIGLRQYRWLPLGLWAAFAAEALEDCVITFSIPDGLQWATRGKAPKRSGPKGYRLEDLQRNVTWWYRCEVADPRVTTYALAKETGYTEPNVRQAVQRVRTFLTCIDAPFPTDT